MSCPIAYPVVLRGSPEISCSGAASGRRVPANVLPRLPGGRRGCPHVLLKAGNRAVPRGEASDPFRLTLRPLPGPLAWITAVAVSNHLLAAARAVPAKEKEKRRARGTPFRRGKP